jgi:hypothetical protein
MKILSLSLIALATAGVTSAQVHIGDATDAHDGAILDLTNSQNRGLLLPNIALQDAEVLTVGGVNTEGFDESAKGMVVYNTNPYDLNGKGVYVWDGHKWVGVSTQGRVIADATYYAPDPTKYVDIEVSVDANGNGSASPITTKTLRFLTYNLGANPALTPKQQMAYQSTATPLIKEDVTVYGGLFQWGRKDYVHASRYNKKDKPDHFTVANEYYTLSYNPDVDHQFVWGSDLSNNTLDWISHIPNSNLWGNGGGLAEQTNSNYSSGNPNANNNLNDPCPSNFRIPTQHELALLGHENGSSASSNDDIFTPILSGITTRSGIVWVPVENGKMDNSWDADGVTRGFALYTAAEWNGGKPKSDLTAENAPNPLMFLPAAGHRHRVDGTVNETGQAGYYRSASYISMAFSKNYVGIYGDVRAFGFSVRCIAE